MRTTICIAFQALTLYLFQQNVSADTYSTICYYQSWAIYQPNGGAFFPSQIDPSYCSVLIYAFAKFDDTGTIQVDDPWGDLCPYQLDADHAHYCGYNDFNQLQSTNTKTMLSVGGWNFKSAPFSNMVADPAMRQNFVNSALNFLTTYGFQGLDIDWEYPAQLGGAPQDPTNFVILLQELHTAFTSNGNNYLLSIAAAACQSRASIAYGDQIPNIFQYVNFINLMAYDIHGAWDNMTGEVAPLYAYPTDTDPTLNVDACVKYWTNYDIDTRKIMLGTPFYGRTFLLSDSAENGIRAPIQNTDGAGPGLYQGQVGLFGYNEIQYYQGLGGWTTVQNSYQLVPYTYNKTIWVGYENPLSITYKANYVKDNSLGGMSIYSVDQDYNHQLANAVKSVLGNPVIPT